MSKKLIQRGLAISASATLALSGFSALPANAYGLADETFVELLPLTGTEYTVLHDQYFDLRSNPSSTISGAGPLKFLVEDPTSVTKFDLDTSVTANASTNAASFTATLSGSTVTVVVTSNGHGLRAGDQVTTSGGTVVATGANDATADTEAENKLNDPITVASATLNTFTYTFTVTGAVTGVTTPGGTLAFVNTAGSEGLQSKAGIEARAFGSRNILGTTVEVQRTSTLPNGWASTYAADYRVSASNGNYVVDTSTTGHSVEKVLRLVNTTATSQSVKVTAWVDANDNGSIDTNEYASPTRTVNFTEVDDLTFSTALSPVVGDKSLTALVTTTPVLNGNQVVAQAGTFLNVKFTRQGSTAELFGPTSSGATSSWSDITKQFTVSVGLDVPANGTDTNATVSTTATSQTNGVWTGLRAPNAVPATTAISISTSGVVTVTMAGHGLSNGDKITMAVDTTGNSGGDAALAIAAESTARTVTVVSSSTFTYSVSETTGLPTSTFTDSSIESGTEFTVATYSDAPRYLTGRVFAGTYSAQAWVGGAAVGAKATAGTVAVAAAKATLSTIGTASVAASASKDNTANLTLIKSGTTSVPMTLQALDSADAAVSAGRPVVISTTSLITGSAAAVGTFRINGLASPVTLFTDASGRVSFTVTEAAGLASAQVRIQAVVEGTVTVGTDLDWATQAYSLVDYGTTDGTIATNAGIARTITSRGSYTLELAVADQWFQPAPTDTYRIVVSGSGVTERIQPLSATGRASVVVTDAGITAAGSTFSSTIAVQKLTAGVWANTSAHTVTTTVAAAPSVVLAADGSVLYQPTGSTLTADLSNAVAKTALVEIDKRSSTTATPDYGNNVVIQGVVRSATTSAAVTNSYVTITGPSNILFTNGNVAKRGSLTFLSNSPDGEFEVILNSTTAQTDTVITVTSMGVSTTTKVTFTGIGVGEGTKLDVTTPASVKPASTFQVKAKLSDVFGNGVEASAGRVKVTYTGPGIVFGTLPDKTDKNGELMFSVLLGSNDTGNVVVTVSYDQNGDADYVDAKDLNTTKTITVGTGAASGTGKVNVGSFNGKLVVYAANLNGARISWKVGGNWGSAVADSNYDIFNRPTPRAGVTVTVDIYVNGVKTLTKSVVTR